MERIAFQLRIREGCIEKYELEHTRVWPALLAEMEELGIHEYSIFRRGQDLFLTLHVPDWNAAFRALQASEVNQKWQQTMAPLFEPVPGQQADEPLAMMKEVFYMPGKKERSTE